MVEGFGDEKIHALIDSPLDLFLEHWADDLLARDRVGRIILPGVTDIPSHQGVAFTRNLFGDANRISIETFQIAFAANRAHFRPMAVVREGNHDLCTGA